MNAPTNYPPPEGERLVTMTTAKQTAVAKRNTANNPSAMLECKDYDEQLSTYAKRVAHELNKLKAFPLTVDLSALQYSVDFHSKAEKGTFKPAKAAKSGEIFGQLQYIFPKSRGAAYLNFVKSISSNF